MKFPVLVGKPVWPSKPLCPQCGKRKVMEPHSMAIFAGGAMRVTDVENKCAEIADDCIGFLKLIWHGAHSEGLRAERDIHTSVSIADETPSGQFELYFCSTGCLRGFMNACVDALEMKVKKARGSRAETRSNAPGSRTMKLDARRQSPRKRARPTGDGK